MDDNRRMTARLLAFVIWAAVAATVVFWGLRLFVGSPSAPTHVGVAGGAAAPRGDVTRLLGGASAPLAANAVATTSSRFRLVGVVAPRVDGSDTGVALIAVDDKPARAYRIGAPVDDSWIVQAVHVRSASLGPRGGATALNLELPPPPAPATGTLVPPVALMPPPQVPAPAVAPLPPAAMTPPPSAAPQALPQGSAPSPLLPPQAAQPQASPVQPRQPEALQIPPKRTQQPMQ